MGYERTQNMDESGNLNMKINGLNMLNAYHKIQRQCEIKGSEFDIYVCQMNLSTRCTFIVLNLKEKKDQKQLVFGSYEDQVIS